MLCNLPNNSPITEGWKIYTSKKLNYSVEIPSEWEVSNNEDGDKYNPMFSLIANPADAQGEEPSGIRVRFPVSIKEPHSDNYEKGFEYGLDGLATNNWSSAPPSYFYLSRGTYFTKTCGKRTLVVKTINNPKPPIGAASWWSDLGQIDYYIDMKDGTIINYSCTWRTGLPSSSENICNHILSSFSFTN